MVDTVTRRRRRLLFGRMSLGHLRQQSVEQLLLGPGRDRHGRRGRIVGWLDGGVCGVGDGRRERKSGAAAFQLGQGDALLQQYVQMRLRPLEGQPLLLEAAVESGEALPRLARPRAHLQLVPQPWRQRQAILYDARIVGRLAGRRHKRRAEVGPLHRH